MKTLRPRGGVLFTSHEPELEVKTGDESADLPEPIAKFLASLRLLVGVPLHYLVPDEGMLPEESIRFFHVDSAWIDALTDGASSIGRQTRNDLVHDTKSSKHVLGHASAGARARRTRAPPTLQGVDGKETTFTGFLLRSRVVTGWPGLEVRARSEKGFLEILRMERIAPSLLLCLFDGPAIAIEVSEPPEGLHFGFDVESGKPGYSKTLRSVTPSKELTEIPFRSHDGQPTRVLRVAALAAAMQSKLPGVKDFSPADFAKDMVERVGAVSFERKEAEDEKHG